MFVIGILMIAIIYDTMINSVFVEAKDSHFVQSHRKYNQYLNQIQRQKIDTIHINMINK